MYIIVVAYITHVSFNDKRTLYFIHLIISLRNRILLGIALQICIIYFIFLVKSEIFTQRYFITLYSTDNFSFFIIMWWPTHCQLFAFFKWKTIRHYNISLSWSICFRFSRKSVIFLFQIESEVLTAQMKTIMWNTLKTENQPGKVKICSIEQTRESAKANTESKL